MEGVQKIEANEILAKKRGTDEIKREKVRQMGEETKARRKSSGGSGAKKKTLLLSSTSLTERAPIS